MRLILEFNKYFIIEKFVSEIYNIFKYVKLKGNKLYASSVLDKGGNPITRIDSKKPLMAILIEFGDDYIVIKSLVNSIKEPNFTKRIMDVISNVIDDSYTIFVEQDVSMGFWDYIMVKYPQFKWIKK
jgi:aminoglycoside N3'-acetyltransferase